MNQLINIENKNGVDMVSSLSIASELGVEHRATLQVIEKYLPEIEGAFGLVSFEMLPDSLGRFNTPVRVAYLTEDQSIFIATLSRNSEKVVQFKTRLVQAFQAARRFIKEVSAPISEEQKILEGYKLLMDRVEVVQEQLKLTQETVKQQAPMVAYYNEVLQSDSGHTATAIAMDFNLAAVTLNRKLKALGVIRKVQGEWFLTSKYLTGGYAFTKKVPVPSTTDTPKTVNQLVWTEKGRQFIHSLLSTKATA